MVIHIIPSYPQGSGTPQKKGKGIVGVQRRELLHTVSLERDRNTALKSAQPLQWPEQDLHKIKLVQAGMDGEGGQESYP